MPQQTPNEEGRHDAHVSRWNIMVILMALLSLLYILVNKIVGEEYIFVSHKYRETW